MMIAMRGVGETMGGATEDLAVLRYVNRMPQPYPDLSLISTFRSDTVTVNATVIHIVDVTAR